MKKSLTSAGFLIVFGIYALAHSVGAGQSTDTASTPTPSSLTLDSTPTAAASPATSPSLAVAPTPKPTPTPVKTASGQYVDGTYTGSSVYVYYGYVQVAATISGGKLSSVQFLQYPSDRNESRQINSYAMPILKGQAIQAQSASVDGVSGASDTSAGFRDSLASALSRAKS